MTNNNNKKKSNINLTNKKRVKAPAMGKSSVIKKYADDYYLKEQHELLNNATKIIKKISDPESNIKLPNVTYGQTGFVNQSDSITTVTISTDVLGALQKFRAMLVPNFRMPLYITNAANNYTDLRLNCRRRFADYGPVMDTITPVGIINEGSTLPEAGITLTTSINTLENRWSSYDNTLKLFDVYDSVGEQWLTPIGVTYIPAQGFSMDLTVSIERQRSGTLNFSVSIYDSSFNLVGTAVSTIGSGNTNTVSFSPVVMDAYSTYDFAYLKVNWTQGLNNDVRAYHYDLSFPAVTVGNYTILAGVQNESYNDLVNLGNLGNFTAGSVLCKYDGAKQTANGNFAIVQVTRDYELSKISGQTRQIIDGTAFTYAGISKVPGCNISSVQEGGYGFWKPESHPDLAFRPLTVDVENAPMIFMAANFTGTGGAFSLTVNSTVRYTTQSQLVSKNYSLVDTAMYSIVLSLLSATSNVSENPDHKTMIHKIATTLDKHKDTIFKVGKGALSIVPPLMLALAAL